MNTKTTETTPALLNTPCIEVDLEPTRTFTVAEYDQVQQERHLQPLWARRTPAVEQLTEEPATGWGARIINQAAYHAQMRVLAGLDSPPLPSTLA